jgi:translation initiation factor IF-2
MAKPRVHEVAKELGLTSKEVLAHLEKIGQPVKSHSSTIDEALAERVRKELVNGASPEAPAEEPAAKPAAEKKTPSAPKKTAPEPTKRPGTEPEAPPAEKPAAEQAVPQVEPPAASEPAAAEPAAAAPEPEAPDAEAAAKTIRVHRGVTVKDFAERIDANPAEIVKILLGLGEMVTVTQSMSDEAVLLVAEQIGMDVQVVDPGQEDVDEEEDAEAEAEEEGELIPRPPVVTVMGHVDHGKTSILDAIRHADVVSGEAGGITQHIGAYQIHHDGRAVTFIDTPGHEAFTAMRARGAQVTDIVVLVVAADDGVKPQTVEAIDHAKAAAVPIVVAVNKIDRPESDPARVRQQLSDYGLLPEEWGGETVFVDVSAKQRTNLDGLIEMILLTADVQLNLKANPKVMARGVVIEAHLDKGRGPVASVLIMRGTLLQGDSLLAGTAWGRVRAMLDERGHQLEDAGPGQPVQVLGWQTVPQAGDEFRSLEDEREARRIAQEREHHQRQADLVEQRTRSLQTLLAATREGEVPELNLLLKADVQGSLGALEGQLEKLDQELVRVTVLRKGVGAITENDVTLAQASKAIVIGFNVVPTAQARVLAEDEGVDVRTYRVIYQAVQDIENAASGLLGPEMREVPIGQAEIRAIFRVPRAGIVAGCYVTEGIIRRNARVRLVRDGVVIYETGLSSLKRFKDDVREVAQGYECGMSLEGYQDIKEGDVVQAFEVQEVAR